MGIKEAKDAEGYGFYPEIAKHSEYDGYNFNDLVYIPEIRQQLKKMGYDGWRGWDVLGNEEIPAIVAFNHSQVKPKAR